MGDVVAKEVAEEEYSRFADTWDLDTDVSEMDDADRMGYEAHHRRLVRAIRNGTLRVDDEGMLDLDLQWTQNGTTLHFTPPDGAASMEWDRFKAEQQIRKMNSLLAGMTKEPPQIFATMDGRDLKYCQSVAMLFLGS